MNSVNKYASREKRTWNFSTLHDLHLTANSLLRQAMLNERYKRWKKVIELYKELLWIIDLKRFPDDYEPPSSYSMLLYELYFHLGVAYQQVENHKEAIKQYSKSIEMVSVAKNGCLAGCLTNTCLMTPIYCRRAFAYAKLGSYKLALKDSEKAVVLDSGSPDVYCIRAMVRSTFDDEIMGLKDLEIALKIDKEHVCAIMLKASFTKPLFSGDTKQQKAFEKLKAKAVRLCQEVETYLTCNSFIHPCVLEFYDKFLFPLSVPHTITRIDLTPEKPSKKQLESKQQESTKTPQSNSTLKESGNSREVAKTNEALVFRCGTSGETTGNKMSLKRRTDYGNALRKFVSRPKSANEFFAQLEKQKRYEAIKRRAQSAILKPGERFARNQSTPFNESCDKVATRPFTAPVNGRASAMSTIRGVSPEKFNSSPVTFSPMLERKENQTFKDDSVKLPPKTKILIETPSNYSIPIFQEVNIKGAPRMYYR
ncbi:hypothetical protein ACF0H5_014207 [Mactra antiquata]